MTRVLRFLIFFISLLLILKLLQLQLIEGKSFIQRSSQNRFRIETIPAERGDIYDRTGLLLAHNQDGKRHYALANNFAHIIGYLGLADSEDLGFFGVEMGKEVGKMGLEKEENQILTGEDGGMVVEISAQGEKLRQYSRKEPIAGRNLQLSLNANLQQTARNLLFQSGYQGAIIAGDINGNLLALVSYPDFDPNIFTLNQQLEIKKVLEDNAKPVFNRAIGGLYPPASTFKLVTAIAGLESKAISQDILIEDTGILHVGDYSYSNWYYTGYGRTDGQVNLVKALQRSNDIFFYKAGEMTGIDEITGWAQKMGLGKKTGIAIEGEAQGLVPDPDWKKTNLDEDWYLGDTYITAIGQGNLLATPIQIQTLVAVIANGGKYCTPSIVAAVVDKPIDLSKSFQNSGQKHCENIGISDSTLQVIKQGMKQACENGGTGWPLFNFQFSNSNLQTDEKNYYKIASSSANIVRVPVACKTGTAEIGGFDQHGKLNEATHAWFTLFAPAENPEVVVTVLLEEAGQGSDKAGPLAKEVLKTYFEEMK